MSGNYFYPGLNGGFNYNPATVPVSLSSSSSYLGDAFSIVFGPVDVVKYRNYKVTVINNSAINSLKSGSLEVSPNGNVWEVVNTASYIGLAPGAVFAVQFSDVSNQSIRFRAWSSGSGGAITGSVGVFLTAN